MKKRVTSLLLAACMICTLLPATAFASEETEPATDAEQIVSEMQEDTTEVSDPDVIEVIMDENGEIIEENVISDGEEAEEVTEDDSLIEETLEAENGGDPVYHVVYQGHVQKIGWQSTVKDGAMAGTSGKSYRVEALKIYVEEETTDGGGNTTVKKLDGAIKAQAHVQGFGWMDWVKDGELCGTSGQSKRVEALKIKLTGELATKYDVYYCTHAQNIGWLNWAKNGASSGTAGLSYRLEAVKILLVKKGESAPDKIGTTNNSFVTETNKGTVTYQTHVQTYGWMNTVADGAVSGTEGQSKRMEAFKIWLNNPEDIYGNTISGSIRYSAHVQSIGWQDWVTNGKPAGTSGLSLRVEAIKIELTGDMKDLYDIYYRVHTQSFGTLNWACNGAPAGSAGYSKRLEYIQIQLVPKGGTAPSGTGRSYVDASGIGSLSGFYYAKGSGSWSSSSTGKDITLGKTGQKMELESIKLAVDTTSKPGLYTGGISYKVLTSDGWSSSGSNGSEVGTVGSGKKIQAVRISLSGELASYCDVYYRAHVKDRGWMGWTKNGSSAGTQDYDLRMEAVEVKIVAKGSSAPGSTAGAFDKFNPKYKDMTAKIQGMTSGSKYLIAVDCQNNLCGVFTGKQNNWTLLYAWSCTTGASATPTIKGQFTIINKRPYFGDTYTAWYASFFQASGYAFHSVLYLPGSKSQFRDPRLGMALSHGCVRLAIENAEWIYNNCPTGTRVYTYK